MKATHIPALLLFGLSILGLFCPAARAVEVAVQPGGRIEGQWVTEPANMREYLTSILLPANAQCTEFEGYLQYTFTGGAAPTLQINGCGPIVHLERGHAGTRPTDHISFGLSISYMAPFSINASELILEFGAPAPDVSSLMIDNFMVNEVEVMEGSMDINMLGMPLSFVASQMHFEFVDNDHLKLTPILPPAPDGVVIEPTPLILRRK
jgi:hypothetical protein